MSFLVGNHTFASVKGPEDYDFLKSCFQPVWEEIGEVISHPNITVMDEQCTLNIVFGSDYKVLCTCTYMYQMYDF